jgi:hypothetical protein
MQLALVAASPGHRPSHVGLIVLRALRCLRLVRLLHIVQVPTVARADTSQNLTSPQHT